MYSPSLITLASAAMTLLPGCMSHIVLENPRPFLKAEDGPSNPNTAATFPCKVPEGARLEMDGAPTEMAIGEDQLLTFSGTAVHGGGSCQISLTSDIDDDFRPNKESHFSVIHSIEGGCPARNQSGNLDGPNTDQYFFKIPAAVSPGNYVLGWTWVPRIGGQPEYYMNCAPITVTASATKAKRMPLSERRESMLTKREVFPDDFPSVWMADMSPLTGDCTHNEALVQQIAIAYPNPGKYVDRPDPNEQLVQQTCDGNPTASAGAPAVSASTTAAASSTPLTSSAVLSSAPATSSSPVATSLVETPTSTVPATTLEVIPITSTAAEATTSSMASSTLISSTMASSTSSSAAPAGTADASTCTEGYLLCVDGTQFSTCTGGSWTAPQPLAPGTTCTGGAGVGLDIVNPY
ncbi:mucin 12, cell surface associated [Pestalotiopsis sp. 9143b]|nr:mucin 12, cell surface associated [Pestalotiopsis sp. 9143b]